MTLLGPRPDKEFTRAAACFKKAASEVPVSGNQDAPICVVDDVASVRDALAALLEAAELPVQVYASAADFLENAPRQVGCLIVDHHMPDMTGLELLRQLKSLGIAPPSIVITGQGDLALEEKVIAAGAITMMHKPVDGDELVTLIERVITNGV